MSEEKPKRVTKTFSPQLLRDILYEECDDYVIVLNELKDKARWSLTYRFVFKGVLSGKCYETHYSRAATEQQDEKPWEYEKEVTCIEVEPYEKTVTDYQPVQG